MVAGFSIGVNVIEEKYGDKNCKSTLEMLQFTLEYLKTYNAGDNT